MAKSISKVTYLLMATVRPSIQKNHPLPHSLTSTYDGATISFRTGRLERELQTVQLSATRCSYIAIL